MTTARRPRGPTDPQRASRIAHATIDVIRRRGLGGLTHRAVAEQAEVPLGSTTYYYANRQALLAAAMEVAIAEFEQLIAGWAVGLGRVNVTSRLAELLRRQSAPGAARERLLVEFELYLAAARSVELRPLSQRWDAVLRNVLEDVLGQDAGRVYFAAYNGLILESLISEETLREDDVKRLLASITTA